jgi:radical SAM superfamily enzyme YgiQ (UPF0313 family)
VPDLVAFTGMTCEAQAVVKLAAEVRSCSQAIIVVGGVHASADPEYFNREEFDWIVVGIGKKSFRELVEALAAGDENINIPGVARTVADKPVQYQPRIYTHADMAEDISPRYDLVEQYRSDYYLESLGIELGFVNSAAGCPYDCSFCCIASLTGGSYLTVATETVIRDIKTLPTPVIRLVDANTFGNPKHAMQLADAIEKAGIRKQFLADVRSDTLNSRK